MCCCLQVVLQARRGQGLRDLQQCHDRLLDVQSQLAMQPVSVCEMRLFAGVMLSDFEEHVPFPAAAYNTAVDDSV